MKTQNWNLTSFIKSACYLGLTILALVACNKKDDNNTNAQTPQGYYMNNGVCYSSNGQMMPNTSYCTNANNGYYLNNGVCYSSSGQMMPNTSYCMNNANNGYYLNNGVCYSSSGQMMPNTSYCMNNANNGYYLNNGVCYSSNGQMMPNTSYCMNMNNGMVGQQCYGSYLYQSGYWSQMVFCNGANCRGYTLYEMNSNRSVTCQ